MTENNTETTRRQGFGAGRIAMMIGGAVAGVMAVGAFALGGIALWADDQKDDQGYISTNSHRFATSTHALATESLDIDLDGAEGLVDTTDLGDIRLKVSPESGKPVFVGIARSDEVSNYLRGVAHSEVTDVDYDPFEADYVSRDGAKKPAAPADQSIWVASTQGAGTQTLDWEADDGDWSIVVMNADGSAGVAADIDAGAKVPFLAEIGWGGIGGGVLLLLTAAGLLVLGGRPPRNRPGAAPMGDPVPAAG
jgi:hypothetical protein